MIKIRNGDYSLFAGTEMKIYTRRYDLPIKDDDREFYLAYSTDLPLKKDFFKSKHSSEYLRSVHPSVMKNAFKINSYARFNSVTFFVTNGPKNGLINLESKDEKKFRKLGYQKYHSDDDQKLTEEELNQSRYFKVQDVFSICVNIYEVDEIWEEYSSSDLNLPMPERLPLRKVIYKKGDVQKPK